MNILSKIFKRKADEISLSINEAERSMQDAINKLNEISQENKLELLKDEIMSLIAAVINYSDKHGYFKLYDIDSKNSLLEMQEKIRETTKLISLTIEELILHKD